MDRRSFLAALAAVPFAGCRPPLAAAAEPAGGVTFPVLKPDWRVFEITTRVTLPGEPGAAQVFLPLVQSAANYQDARTLHWDGNGTTERLHDARYGASMLRTTWDARQTGTRSLEVVQVVATADRGAANFLPLTSAERKFWLAPTQSIPTEGLILETAARITFGKANQREQLRALYDWVVDHTYRDPDTPGCGNGDVGTHLQSGHFGGKCADINGLMGGFARAAGLPAREVYGLRVAPSLFYPSLGRSDDVTRAQHCRVEVFLDEEGWFPIDPGDVRKAVLEQKIALDSAEGRALRDRMFGHWEMNWVGYNSATDIELPGGGLTKPDFGFLMYPCGFTEAGPLPCLDPAHFQYEIKAREVNT